MSSSRSAVFILLGLFVGLSMGSYQLFTSLGNITQKNISLVEEIDQLKTPANIVSSPVHLFDIKLEMDKAKIRENNDVVARVLFTNFGTVPTHVSMTFTIVNEQKKITHQETDSITVETESVFRKTLKSLRLKPGKYTLVLKTIYGNTVEDEFSQQFEIVRKKFLGIF